MPIIVATGPDTFKFIDDGRPQAGAENYTYYDSADEAPEEVRKIVESPRNPKAKRGTYGSTGLAPGNQPAQEPQGRTTERAAPTVQQPRVGAIGASGGNQRQRRGGIAQAGQSVFNPDTGTVQKPKMTWQSAKQRGGGLMEQGAANLDRELARRRGEGMRVTPAYYDRAAAQPAVRSNTPAQPGTQPTAPGQFVPARLSTGSSSSPAAVQTPAEPTYSQLWRGSYKNTPQEDLILVGQAVMDAAERSPAGVVVRKSASAVGDIGRAIGQGVTAGAEALVASPPREYMVEPIETMGWAKRQIDAGYPSRVMDPYSGDSPSYISQGVAAVKGLDEKYSSRATDPFTGEVPSYLDQAGGTVTQVIPNLAKPVMDAGGALVSQAASDIGAPYRIGRTALEMIAADPVAAVTTGARTILGMDNRAPAEPRGQPAPESAYLFENRYTDTPDFTDSADMGRMQAMTRYIVANGSDNIIPAATPGYETLTAGYGGSGGSDYPYLQWRRPYGGGMPGEPYAEDPQAPLNEYWRLLNRPGPNPNMYGSGTPGEPYAEGPQRSWGSTDVDRYRALQGSIIPVEVPPYTPPEPARSRFRMVIPSYGQ